MALAKRKFDDLITFTRNSAATYWDANGVLQTAAIDEPRFDHDPVTGEPLGILIEEQRTNEQLLTNDMTSFAQGSYFTSEPVQSVFGNESVAAKFTRGNNPGSPGLKNLFNTTSQGEIWTVSAIYELNPGDEVKMGLRDVTQSGWAAYVFYTHGSGLSGFSENTSGQTEPKYRYKELGPGPNGGELVRVMVTADVTNGNHLRGSVYNNTDNQEGSTTIVHHVQTEKGKFASSPIVTGSSAVVRDYDTPVVNVTEPPFVQGTGTLYFRVFAAPYEEKGTQHVMGLSPAGNNYNVLVRITGYGLSFATRDDETSMYNKAHQLSDYSDIRGAYSYSDGYFASTANGQDAYVKNSGQTDKNQIKLYIGGSKFGGILNGHVYEVRYYPEVFSAEKLKDMTK